jgi:hypothetical protein
VWFPKKACRDTYDELVFLHLVGSVGYVVHLLHSGHKTSMHYFYAGVGPVRISQIVRQDTLHRTCVFASGGICGSHTTFWSVRGVKHRHTIFHNWVGPVGFP